ncbi:MAG: hypothetical protein WCD20_14510 [Rhodomicrobium sp.]
MRREDPSEAAFAAFYADCLHEVLPITSGCRLTLIYNLVRNAGALPEPPNYRSEQDRVAGLLRQWADAAGTPDDAFPEKIVYPLQHAYMPAELSFEALKGADAAVASVLMSAAPPAACELHLALLTIEESGSAEHTGYYGSRWGRRGEEDADQFEVIEVTDYSATLGNWMRADGAPCMLAAIPFQEEEISPPEALEDLEPDEEHFQEATGNEGASFERTYRRAALTLWPSAQRLTALNRGGLKLTLPYLAGLAARWEAAGAEAGTALWRETDELCGLVIASWPAGRGYPRRDGGESPEAAMLTLLTRFKNAPRIEAFLASVSAGGAFGGDDAESVVQTEFMSAQGYEAGANTLPAVLGRRAALAILHSRRADASNADGAYMDTSGYMPRNPSRLDSWQPTTTDILSVNPRMFKPVTPHWGKVMTFALERADQFTPPPPPAPGTGRVRCAD